VRAPGVPPYAGETHLASRRIPTSTGSVRSSSSRSATRRTCGSAGSPKRGPGCTPPRFPPLCTRLEAPERPETGGSVPKTPPRNEVLQEIHRRRQRCPDQSGRDCHRYPALVLIDGPDGIRGQWAIYPTGASDKLLRFARGDLERILSSNGRRRTSPITAVPASPTIQWPSRSRIGAAGRSGRVPAL